MQWFVYNSWRSEVHLPSSVKEWQMPRLAALPMPPGTLARVVPLEEQETSYLADSARIVNLVSMVSFMAQLVLQFFVYICYAICN